MKAGEGPERPSRVPLPPKKGKPENLQDKLLLVGDAPRQGPLPAVAWWIGAGVWLALAWWLDPDTRSGDTAHLSLGAMGASLLGFLLLPVLISMWHQTLSRQPGPLGRPPGAALILVTVVEVALISYTVRMVTAIMAFEEAARMGR